MVSVVSEVQGKGHNMCPLPSHVSTGVQGHMQVTAKDSTAGRMARLDQGDLLKDHEDPDP